MRPWRLWFLALALVAGCTMSMDPNRASGKDGERYSAPGAELNKTYMDSVDYDAGDASDWRHVLIGQQGILTVACHFDEIDAKVVMRIKDAVGTTLATQYNTGEARQEATAKVKKGKYYIEVTALEAGAKTTYTCEPSFVPVVWD